MIVLLCDSPHYNKWSQDSKMIFLPADCPSSNECRILNMVLFCSDELLLNTLRPGHDGRHFADDIFTCIVINENCCIVIKFSLKCVRKIQLTIIQHLVQIMAWRRSGDKPLSEPMTVNLSTHICVTRLQWVNNNQGMNVTLQTLLWLLLCWH